MEYLGRRCQVRFAFSFASANLYSLIETAKANGIEPFAYLKTVFTDLPKADTVGDVEALLPIVETAEQREAA